MITNQNFGQAVEALNIGKRVSREGWNGKNMFVYKTVGNTVSKDFISKFTSLPDSVKDFLLIKGDDVVFHSNITIYTATGEMQPGWLASQADILANDWCILD